MELKIKFKISFETRCYIVRVFSISGAYRLIDFAPYLFRIPLKPDTIFRSIFPEQEYRHSGAPDFEVSEEGDMTSDAYRMQLWVPIEKE